MSARSTQKYNGTVGLRRQVIRVNNLSATEPTTGTPVTVTVGVARAVRGTDLTNPVIAGWFRTPSDGDRRVNVFSGTNGVYEGSASCSLELEAIG